MCKKMDNDEDTLGEVPESLNTQELREAKSHLIEQDNNVIVMNGNAHAESKHENTTTADGDENESAEVIRENAAEDEEQLDLKPELQEGLKILNSFLADKKLTEPFRDEVFKQLSESEIQKYKKEINEPMCLSRMKEKFQTGEYDSITQVVNDFHLMIYNCQRFNGISHPVSKKAAKISVILKQKLNLLKSDIRSKIAQDSSMPWLSKQEVQDNSCGSGFRKRTANHRLDDSSAMINHLRKEEEQKAREERRLKKEEHRAAQAAAERDLIDWEEENVTIEPIKSVIQHSWELPQIGLFLFLCRDVLVLEEVPMYELERCLAMARQSKRLHQIMTALLSTPYQREKREEKSMPDMPYPVWTRKLSEMMDTWYKVLDSCCGNKFHAACKLGLVEQSFDVIGVKNPLKEKLFHNLSFYRKVWILKSLCDYLVEKEENLRTAIENQDPMDQRGLLLGADRHGNQYIHFTQFCGPNLRIYRQRRPPVPVVRDEEEGENVDEEEAQTSRKPVKGKSSAKRKLNLDGSNAKRSRSATPLNDSETDGTISPAPSDTRTKSRASSSRHSSPLPRETNGRSRQASARNSPAPDSLSLDSFSVNNPFGKGRKTRNSAESTFFGNMDLESLLRQRSRRSRGTKNVTKEITDAESISTIGDESSQDGRADTPSSTSAFDGDVKTEMELVNGKLSTEAEERVWTQSEVKSESQDSSDVDSVQKVGQSTHSHVCSMEDNRTESDDVHIKLEPDSIKCDRDSETREDNADCVKPVDGCDIQLEVNDKNQCTCPTSADTTPAPSATASDGSNLKSVTCDTNRRSAAPGNPSTSHVSVTVSTPVPFSSTKVKLANLSSIKKEGNSDDSGFLSFQTPPRIASADAVCDEDDAKHIPESGEKSNSCYTSVGDGSVINSIKQERDMDDANSSEDQVEKVSDVKMEDSSLQNDDSTCSSQCNGAMDSKMNQDHGDHAVSNALLDHADYSEEEMVPDPGEFELIVEDMEGLDRLIKQFDPEQVQSSPQISPGPRAGKRQKSKSTPKTVKYWACEKELYERLVSMQVELQQYRSKLALLTKKARLKLQKEFFNFTEETPKVDELRAWESESDSDQSTDESGAEGSVSGKDSEDSEDAPSDSVSAADSKPKVPCKAESAGSIEALGMDQRDIEEYEADVSSRGRLRKRRLIPNNIEDQGVKKKKVVKKAEEATPTTTASQMSSLVCRSEDGTIKLNISNSEFLAMVEQGGPAASELVQKLAAANSPSGQALGWKPQGIKVIGGPIPHGSGEGAGAPKVSVAHSSSHPVMQKILSTQNPGNLRPVTGFTTEKKKLDIVPVSSSSVSSHSSSVAIAAVTSSSVMPVSRAAGSGSVAGLNLNSSLLMTASMKGGRQQVFVVTPEQKEKLLRSGILQCQEPRQTLQVATSIVRPQVVTCSAGINSTVSLASHSTTGIKQLTAVRQVVPPQGQRYITPQGQPGVIAAQPISTPDPSQVPGQGRLRALASLAPAKVQEGVGTVTQVKIVATPNGQEMVGVPVVMNQVLPRPGLKAPVIVNNATGSRTLILQSGRSLPRYAGNVTVKELLENRAANKTEESDATSTSDSSQSKSSNNGPHGRIVMTTVSMPVTSPLSIVTTRVQKTVPSTSLVQQLVPGVVRLPSQSTLDDALQTVVTSYHTTLPTADIKVPSPTTLPSLSPRKNITRIVQSTKAPIPTTTKVQAKHSPVVLTSTLVSGSSALATGNRVVSGVLPAGTVVRPGTVVLPAGQALAGVDVARKDQLVVQVLPRGVAGAGSVAQRYVLPQGGSILQVTNARTTPAMSTVQESPALSVFHSQAHPPVPTTSLTSSTLVHAGSLAAETQLPSNQNGQSLLTTVAFSSANAVNPTAAGSSSPSAAMTKTTSEVLKSMLAAKAVALTNAPPATRSSATAVLQTTVTSSAGMAQISSQSGSILNQHTVAPLAQMPRVIRAPVAGVGSVVSNVQQGTRVVHQGGPRIMQTPAPIGLQLQNLAVAGLPVSVKSNSGHVDSQRMGLPSMVRMSLPAGVQVAGVQPGGTTIRLVGTSQAGTGTAGSLQPVLATIKPGAQGLQQLQLLATAGGLPGVQMGGQTQQHMTFKTGVCVGQGAGGHAMAVVGPTEEHKQTVQLCFTMQPGAQGMINSTASSVMPQTVIQGTAGLQAASSALQGSFPGLGSPPLSPINSGTVSKVIMANPASSLPIPAPIQPNSACSVLNQASVTTLNSAENRLMLSITPGALKSQFIVSPVCSQSSVDISNPVIRQSVPSQTSVDSKDGQTLPLQSATQLPNTFKRSLSSTDLHPIPAKKACLETGGSSNSGAVLASLSQMIGSTKSTCISGDAAATTSVRDPGNSSLQKVVMASSGGGDNSASCTLLNLAAHVSTGSALATAVSTALPSAPAAAAISAPLLQQLTAPLIGRPQQAAPQKQMVAVRNIGGQLLTDSNIPVTENNGEYKVLPKATLQIGSQTVTVLSPSSAMIQNVRNPTSANIIPAVTNCQTPTSSTLAPLPTLPAVQAPKGGAVVEGGASGSSIQSQGLVRTILRPDVNPEKVLAMFSQGHLKSPPQGNPPEATDTRPVWQEAIASSASVAAPVMLEAPAMKQVSSMNNTPLLKARLEQPRLGPAARISNVSGANDSLNGVEKSQPQVGEGGLTALGENRNTESTALTSSGLAVGGCVNGDSKKNVEEEAALNLLTLANQGVL